FSSTAAGPPGDRPRGGRGNYKGHLSRPNTEAGVDRVSKSYLERQEWQNNNACHKSGIGNLPRCNTGPTITPELAGSLEQMAPQTAYGRRILAPCQPSGTSTF